MIWLLLACGPGEEVEEEPITETPEAFALGPVVRCEQPVELSFDEVSESLGLHGPSKSDGFHGEGGGTILEDLDGDGLLDLLYGPGFNSWLHLGTGPGTFGAGAEFEFEGGFAVLEPGAGRILFAREALYDVDLFAQDFEVWAEPQAGLFRAPSVADFNGDGWDDLYLGRGDSESDEARLDQIFWGSAEGFGEMALAPANPQQPGEAFDSVVLDFNQDGYPDLYVVNDRGPERGPNRLYSGGPDGLALVEDCGACGLMHSPMGVDAADINGDGWVDLFIASTTQNELLWGGPDGRFVQAPPSVGQTAFTLDSMGWGGVVADVDNDGLPDLWVGAGEQSYEGGSFGVPERPYLQLQGEDGRFTDVSLELGLDRVGSWRTTVAHDLNQDGVLDLFLSSPYEAPRLWMSAGCTQASWLEVVAPPMSRVDVYTESGVQTAWVTRESSFQSVKPAVAHFGLGEDERVDRVVVELPLAGGRFEIADLQARRTLTLTPAQ